MKKRFLIFSLILLILLDLAFISLALAQSYSVSTNSCTREGVLITVSGTQYAIKEWATACMGFCQDSSYCRCIETTTGSILGVLVFNEIPQEHFQKMRGGRLAGSTRFANQLEYVGNSLVGPCKSGGVTILEELHINNDGTITTGVLDVRRSFVRVGRMIRADRNPEDVEVSGAYVNFTSDTIIVYDTYKKEVPNPCAGFTKDTLFIVPTREPVTIPFKSELSYINRVSGLFVAAYRALVTAPAFVMSARAPFYVYYNDCSKEDYLITPSSYDQAFAIILSDLRSKQLLCSSANFEFKGNNVGGDRCVNIVDGSLAFLKKEGNQYTWVEETKMKGKDIYYNIFESSIPGTVLSQVFKIEDNNIVSTSGNFEIRKVVGKSQTEIKSEIMA